jgi:hypothetical protein
MTLIMIEVKMNEKIGILKRKVFKDVREPSIRIEIQKGKFLKNKKTNKENRPLQQGPKSEKTTQIDSPHHEESNDTKIISI